jgi:hypothetical protein
MGGGAFKTDMSAVECKVDLNIHPKLKILLKDENLHCVDCGKSPAAWASLSFGVIICIECAGYHRSLGVHITQVRSITMDDWTDLQVGYIMNGGNKLFKAYSKLNHRNTQNIFEKYSQNIILYYK